MTSSSINNSRSDTQAQTGDNRVEVLPRSHVERIAAIVGPGSAASQALACADRGEHGDSPIFIRPVGGTRNYIAVTDATNVIGGDDA